MSNNRTCNEKDLYIAKKLRAQRIQLKLNQSDLANKLGLTSQQIYKYEKGIDRVPASRLKDIASILSVPLTFFYEESEEDISCEMMKELVVTCANLQGKKVRLKFLKLKAILTDIQTQEEHEIDIT